MQLSNSAENKEKVNMCQNGIVFDILKKYLIYQFVLQKEFFRFKTKSILHEHQNDNAFLPDYFHFECK